MCGRFTLIADPANLHAEFGISELPFDYAARYNIAPAQPVLGLVAADEGWAPAGFFWGAAPGAARGAMHINARAETIATRPTFRSSFRKRRCLVLADGFYEWRQESGRRVPMYICRIDRRPFAFAGIWEESLQPDGVSVFTCTIITTEPNDLMRPIHDRMPVIVSRRDYDVWLSPESSLHQLDRILAPAGSDGFEAFAVATLVNSPRNDVPECIAPATPAASEELDLLADAG